jgi:hypothetical protein
VALGCHGPSALPKRTRPDVTEPTPLTGNRSDTGADILLYVTSRTRTRVRRTAVVTTLVGLSLLVAGPASAKVPEGWSDPPQVPMQQVLLVLVVLPLLLITLITAAVYVPALVRGERVAPGAAPVQDQWFGGPRGGTRELEAGSERDEQTAQGETGGAGGRW